VIEINFERIWCMPNSNTFLIKPITKLIHEEITTGIWLDPFANESTFKNLLHNNTDLRIIDNDLNPKYNTDYHMDALEFLKMFDDNSIDGLVYDPPYSLRQVSECYKNVGITVTQETTQSSWRSKHIDEITRIIKPNGKVFCFGWNSSGIGKVRGFKLERILLIPHGGSHNDTIVTVEVKNK
jgi:hypothetical protein